MDKFRFSDSSLSSFSFGEFQICSQEGGVRLYDGSHKTDFENGEVVVTSHRLIWRGKGERGGEIVSLVLPLSCVKSVEEEAGGFMSSPKVIVNVEGSNPVSGPSPQGRGSAFVKLSFKSGGHAEFYAKMIEAIQMGQWKMKPQQSRPQSSRPQTGGARKMRSGIGGIEKQIVAKNKQTDKQISKAFQDLDQLMEMAKPMVSLAKNISGKIRVRMKRNQIILLWFNWL